MKVGGMCWVISTGARSITLPILCISAGQGLRAAGRGADQQERAAAPRGNGRRMSAAARAARAAATCRMLGSAIRARPALASGDRAVDRLRAQAKLADFLDQLAAERGGGIDRPLTGLRLRDVVGGAERQRLQADLGVPPRQRRRHDDDEVALLLQQQRQRGEPVELRHVDVEHDDVRIGLLELLDRFAAGAQRRRRLAGRARRRPSARTGRAPPRRRRRS